MSTKDDFKQQKQRLILQGETLRLQIALDVLESKEHFKPLNLAWHFVRSAKGIALVSALLTQRKKGSRVALVLVLANLFLWAKKKFK